LDGHLARFDADTLDPGVILPIPKIDRDRRLDKLTGIGHGP
jgi:hypothetical protein